MRIEGFERVEKEFSTNFALGIGTFQKEIKRERWREVERQRERERERSRERGREREVERENELGLSKDQERKIRTRLDTSIDFSENETKRDQERDPDQTRYEYRFFSVLEGLDTRIDFFTLGRGLVVSGVTLPWLAAAHSGAPARVEISASALALSAAVIAAPSPGGSSSRRRPDTPRIPNPLAHLDVDGVSDFVAAPNDKNNINAGPKFLVKNV
ncbi:hypothetical protein EAE99_001008 [Botrytis elliptica]|nr:hypothetical protein EAE99_001008 [Botrytis elliptica]